MLSSIVVNKNIALTVIIATEINAIKSLIVSCLQRKIEKYSTASWLGLQYGSVIFLKQ